MPFLEYNLTCNQTSIPQTVTIQSNSPLNSATLVTVFSPAADAIPTPLHFIMQMYEISYTTFAGPADTLSTWT